jgi:hypothetical protein
MKPYIKITTFLLWLAIAYAYGVLVGIWFML